MGVKDQRCRQPLEFLPVEPDPKPEAVSLEDSEEDLNGWCAGETPKPQRAKSPSAPRPPPPNADVILVSDDEEEDTVVVGGGDCTAQVTPEVSVHAVRHKYLAVQQIKTRSGGPVSMRRYCLGR